MDRYTILNVNHSEYPMLSSISRGEDGCTHAFFYATKEEDSMTMTKYAAEQVLDWLGGEQYGLFIKKIRS